ncbi:hypothetical protein AB0271_10560 [Kocuria palustris]|uniref:hypothetical protein n=1 Tax=Kocuria palustris TaxID=71999 RepID=UPI00344ECB6F
MALPPLSRMYAPRTLAFAAGSGLGEMIPFHRARGAGRAAIITVPGLAGAGLTAWTIRRKNEPLAPGEGSERMLALTTAGLAVGVGALLSGSTALSLALDGAFERFLVRRGVRRPLLVMGATGLVVGWAMEYFDVDSDDADPHPADASGTDARITTGPQSADDDAQPSQSGVGKHRDDRPVDAPPRA